MKYILSLITLVLFFVSCKKESTEVNMHLDYFDLTPGRFIIYDVTEINHNNSASHDTLYYQIKTVIGDTVHDNENRIARKYIRYKRNNSSQDWVIKDVWTAIIADYKAELIEENQRIVKLVFAPTLSKEWNANVYNTFPEQETYYEEIHQPYEVGSQTFDSTVSVIQENDPPNLIEYKSKYEIYAKGIGMIKKRYVDLSINNFDVTDINNGKELYMNVVSYGIE